MGSKIYEESLGLFKGHLLYERVIKVVLDYYAHNGYPYTRVYKEHQHGVEDNFKYRSNNINNENKK